MQSRASNSKWRMLAVSFLVIVGMSLPYYGWTPSLTSIAADLSLDYAQAASLMSVTAAMGGIAVVLGGALVVRVGPKSVILAALALSIAGQVLFAHVDGYTGALVARAVSGVAVGLLIVAPYTLAISWFLESGQAGRAAGVMLAGDGIGVLFALVVVAMVLGSVDWRGGLLVQAGYLAVLFFAALFLLKNAPAPETAEERGQDAEGTRTKAFGAILRAVRTRPVLSAMAFYTGTWGLFSLVVSWMPTILMNAGWPESVAGLFSSSSSLAGIITAVAFGLLSHRVTGRRKLVIVLAGITTAAFVGLLCYAVAVGNYTLAAVSLPLIGLAGYAGASLSLTAANESVDGEHVGAVNGLVLGCALLVGGVLYPYVVGAIRDMTGSFAVGFLVVAISTFVLCFVAPLFGFDEGKSQVPSPEAAVRSEVRAVEA
ncbi:sugar phosphate permease [Streptomyces sp. PanSC19]|uniref:MFS transporter n=1 Tax=Streptomyces sp. PanSC19 TaxID=1520455 RepID=UPI000F484BC9|nr:MFS transporter [Streptomyces sp. PanSC19]ROQ35874.1 sugar phosphate permease [Streptomyces sp. PanSC19]